MKPYYFYILFFWIIWLLAIPFILKFIPAGSELISMVIYSLLGLALYVSIPAMVDAFIDKIEEKRYEAGHAKSGDKAKFLVEQRLRRKYRYIKLNVKENIINSPSIEKSDKLLLLQIMHDCTPDEAYNLLGTVKKE